MAMGIVSVTVPAFAAAAGFYFLDKTHHSAHQELRIGKQASAASMVAKVKDQVKSSSQFPELAPQFDGLYCFETLIGH